MGRIGWRLELSRIWDVLGPFPVHAREQHFLSPSFPLNLTKPVDFGRSWPSSYADGGKVSWSKTCSDVGGTLNVRFPNIRWSSLRATEGWAALQHHAVLRTSFTLYPPQGTDLEPHDPPHLLVKLKQGSFFTVLPASGMRSEPAQWYPGNIYNMERAVPSTVHLPVPPSKSAPTKYDVFISGDYEIRLFGDPQAHGNDVPTLSINLSISLESPQHALVREPTQDVLCDFVDGFAFGAAIGVGFRSISGWWTLKRIEPIGEAYHGIQVTILRETRIAPTQTRIIPIKVIQSAPFFENEIRLALTWVSETSSTTISVVLPVNHRPCWNASPVSPINATYFFAESMPTPFLATPPIEPNVGEPHPPVVALHGAGVDIIEQPFFTRSIPRQKHSWVVFPTGRTSWGLDWHGPSAQDVWESLDALNAILNGRTSWQPWKIAKATPVVVIGHSNGGQGCWYLGSRYPDRVLAVVAAAGYIKPQAYIPLTMSRSAHFTDPTLRAILESALTPDDNDLFLSNLVDTPVLAVHGGADDNVPTWHSREAVGILQAWNPDANVTLREDEGQRHWYTSVFKNAEIQAFLDSILDSSNRSKARSKSFTLTVAVPSESGSLHGWKIESLDVPGSLARLCVREKDGHFHVETANVASFSTRYCKLSELVVVDGVSVAIPPTRHDGVIRLQASGHKNWVLSTAELPTQSSGGRAQAILNTAAPFTIIIPDATPGQEFSVALRIAHSLNVYHRLDAEIIESSEAVERMTNGSLASGNVVVIGSARTPFVKLVLERKETPFGVDGAVLSLRGRAIVEPGIGILFTHPYPSSSSKEMLFLLANDASGFEKAVRLFPIRTSITVPDWLIIGDGADQVGAGGVIGAGVWGDNWTWNQQMSWLY